MVARSGRTPDGFRWRLAPCLVVLEDEVNARHPGRSKRSDGSIASAAHSKQNPTSDHEADRGDGLVKALDLTDDPPRFDPDDLCEQIRRRRDPRIKYMIADQRICRSYAKPGIPAWSWSRYTGSNPHTSHAHISVTDEGANDTSTWFPSDDEPAPAPQEDDLMAIIDPDCRGQARTQMRLFLGRSPETYAELDFHAGEIKRLGLNGYIEWLEQQTEAVAWADKIGAEVRSPDKG